MPGMMVIYPGGQVTREPITKCPELETLQKAVGGSIEVVPHWETFNEEEAIVLCNEEGKLNGLPFNRVATDMWQIITGYTEDELVGPVVILFGKEIVEDF